MSAPAVTGEARRGAAGDLTQVWSAVDDAMSRRFLAHGLAVCLTAVMPALVLFRPDLHVLFLWELGRLGDAGVSALPIATTVFGAILVAAAVVPRRRPWRFAAALVAFAAWCVVAAQPIAVLIGTILIDSPDLILFVQVFSALVAVVVVCIAAGARIRADAPGSRAARVLLAAGGGVLLATFVIPLPTFGWLPFIAALVRVWLGVGRDFQLIVTASIVPALVLMTVAVAAVLLARRRARPDPDSGDTRIACRLTEKGALLAAPVFVALFAGSTLGGGVAALFFVAAAVGLYAGLHLLATATTALLAHREGPGDASDPRAPSSDLGSR